MTFGAEKLLRRGCLTGGVRIDNERVHISIRAHLTRIVTRIADSVDIIVAAEQQ